MTTSLIPGNTGVGPCFPRPFCPLKCYSAVTLFPWQWGETPQELWGTPQFQWQTPQELWGFHFGDWGVGDQSSEEIKVNRWRARVQQIYSNFWSWGVNPSVQTITWSNSRPLAK